MNNSSSVKIFSLSLLLLALFISGVLSAVKCEYDHKEPCDFHTLEYQEYKKGGSNDVYQMYIPQTFGGRLALDPCQPYSGHEDEYFYALGNVTCQGPLCTNDTFGNKLSVVYIIDTRNSMLPNCSHDLMGNIVLSNQQWAAQMKMKSWAIVKSEKQAIYGSTFDKAIELIKKCNPGCAPKSLSTDTRDRIIAAVVVTVAACVVLVLSTTCLVALGITVYYWMYKPNYDRLQ